MHIRKNTDAKKCIGNGIKQVSDRSHYQLVSLEMVVGMNQYTVIRPRFLSELPHNDDFKLITHRRNNIHSISFQLSATGNDARHRGCVQIQIIIDERSLGVAICPIVLSICFVMCPLATQRSIPNRQRIHE
jgi:hypothetical protein